jgi:hypothetical protein
MRKMKSVTSNDVLEINEHIILRNFWEYYIINEETNDADVKLGYVMGFENEIGYVYMPEIKPYVLTRTNDLKNVMPASGYEWID